MKKHSFRIHKLIPTCLWTFPPPQSFHATREVTLSVRKSIPSKNNLRGIMMGIGPIWGSTSLTLDILLFTYIVIFLVLQRHRHLGRVFCNRSKSKKAGTDDNYCNSWILFKFWILVIIFLCLLKVRVENKKRYRMVEIHQRNINVPQKVFIKAKESGHIPGLASIPIKLGPLRNHTV